MRVFGSKAYVHVPYQLRRKLDPLSTAGIFIGYEPNSKAYRVLMDSGKAQISKDVIFLERVPSAANKAAATEAEQANNTVSAGVPDSPIIVQEDSSEADSTGIDLGPPTPLTQKLRKKLLRQPLRKLSQQLRIQLPPQLRRLSSHAFLKGRACKHPKQAPSPWNTRLKQELEGMGLTASGADAGLFTAQYKGNNIYILVYVDDILVAAKNLADINHVKARLTAIFDVRDLGEAKYFLGMSLDRDRQA